MSEELAKWAPGMSLEWALVSLTFGIVLLAIIVVRLFLEFKRFDEPGDDDLDEAVQTD